MEKYEFFVKYSVVFHNKKSHALDFPYGAGEISDESHTKDSTWYEGRECVGSWRVNERARGERTEKIALVEYS